MRRTIRNSAALGATYAVALVCGLGTAKVLASIIGTEGYGYFSLYGVILSTGLTLAASGIAMGLPRLGAPIVASKGWLDLKAAAVAITFMTALVGAVVLTTLRRPIGELVLNQPLGLVPSLLLSVAFLFGAQAPVQNAILKTERHIRRLVVADSVTAVAASLGTVVIVATLKVEGIVGAMALSAVLKWAIFSRWTGLLPRPVSRQAMIDATRTLFRFGLTYSVTSALASLLAVLLPVLILHFANLADVGLYAAATTVVGLYTGLLGSVMGRDFYPRLAGITLEHPQLGRVVEEEHELILLLALPASVILIAAAPFVIPIVYSPSFLPMVGLVDWLAVASILRASGGVYAYVVLAKLPRHHYLALEGLSGVLAIALAIMGMLRWGLVGIGIAAVASTAVHLVYAAHLARRHAGLSMSAVAKRGVAIATALAVGSVGAQTIPVSAWRDAVSLFMAMACGLACLRILRARWGASAMPGSQSVRV